MVSTLLTQMEWLRTLWDGIRFSTKEEVVSRQVAFDEYEPLYLHLLVVYIYINSVSVRYHVLTGTLVQ